ncbi:hypothetical protein BDP27DRAFT_292095 [Rhodocollybia butyracea]|uniref:Uncharacterized protein n=1 Tax=Rhodocollybia butyracea TaxID=206335 RepID=A0A9P5PFJ7_9AGAR|nr:hypothetical protein BDP27DRAFT_292095 [Rhodocollybia butyracea]
MLVLLELVLILRVFALYDRNRAIGTFLSLLLVLRITSSTHSVYHHVLQFPEKTQFTNHCVPSVNYRDAHSPVWMWCTERSVGDHYPEYEAHRLGLSPVFSLVVLCLEQRWSESVRRYCCGRGCNSRDGDRGRRDFIFIRISHFHTINFCCGMPHHS